MRRALATVTIAGAVALVPFTATTAFADSTSAGTTVLAEAEQPVEEEVLNEDVEVDEPLEQDGDDDTGKYGLIGLSGLFGLFGYKKYKEHRAATTRSTGTTGDGTTGGSSRRV
jgi:hypothetical protein